ncbi:MAG: hypothetical protein ACJ796_19965 [Gemmatimonadaceae bacterium]
MRKKFILRMWHSWLHGLAIAAALFTGRAASAQATDSSRAAAQAVGLAYLNAIQAADWKAAAAFLDRATLDHYRLMQANAARQMHQPSTMTVDRLMKLDPKMPRAVAEWQVQRMNDHSHQANFLEHEFGVTDPDSLAAMPMELVAQRWLERRDPRWAVRAALRASNCSTSVADSLLPTPKFAVLGTVAKDGMAYLLYERDDDPAMIIDDVRSRGPSMVVLHRRIDTWWVIPRLEMGNVGGLSMSCAYNAPRRN